MDAVIFVFAAAIVLVWAYTIAMRMKLRNERMPQRAYTKQLYVAWVVTIVSVVFIVTRLIPNIPPK